MTKENKSLNHTIEQLKNELSNMQHEVDNVKKENKSLIEEIPIKENRLIISEEGFFVKPELLFPDDLSIERVSDLLGEPVGIREYIEVAHCGCKEIELTYDDASFTFQMLDDKEVIKWMTIKDSFFASQRGITIGSSKEQVIEAYGENYWTNKNGISYGEKTGISFNFNNDIVTEITIWYMYE
jgi:hypothetical protein